MHSYSLQYMVILIVFVGALVILGVRRYRQDAGKRRQFLMVHDQWPRSAKEGAAMLVLMFFIVPCAIFFTSGVFGSVLAAAEEWSWTTGFDYVVSNVAGLSNPLTSVSPTSTIGIFLDVIVSVWAMLLANSFMGVTANMGCVQRIIDSMPGTTLAFMRYTFVYIPVVLLVLSLFVGIMLASIEDWSPLTGFLFSVSALCGLANPLTSVSPITTGGAFVELIGVLAELTLGGAIIGIVSSHPLCNRLICMLEGPTNLVHALQVSAERIRQAEFRHNLGGTSWREKADIVTEEMAAAVSSTLKGEVLSVESEVAEHLSEVAEHAPNVMPGKIELHQSQGTVGLPTWQCTWPNGCAIRLRPLYTAQRRADPGPMEGEVFQVSHCRTGTDGILHLRLADGRGWLPTTNPLGELMCVHYETSSVGPWQVNSQHADGVRVRSECSSAASVVRVMEAGVTFRARQEGNWLALADGQGFLMIRRPDGIFLVQRVDASEDFALPLPPVAQTLHFHVCVTRSQDVSLGFQAQSAEGGVHLVVERVLGGSLAGWNEAHPHRAVIPCDRIVQINERHDAEAMLAEIESALMLHILIERDRPVCLEEGAVASPAEEVASALPGSSTQPIYTNLRMLSMQPGGTVYRAENEQGALMDVEIDWSLLSGPGGGGDVHAEVEPHAEAEPAAGGIQTRQLEPPNVETASDLLLAAERSEAESRLVASAARVVEAELIAEEANRRASEAEARAIDVEVVQRIAAEANKRAAAAEARAAKAEAEAENMIRAVQDLRANSLPPGSPPPTSGTPWLSPEGSMQGQQNRGQLPQQGTVGRSPAPEPAVSNHSQPRSLSLKNRTCGSVFCWDKDSRSAGKESRSAGGNVNSAS